MLYAFGVIRVASVVGNSGNDSLVMIYGPKLMVIWFCRWKIRQDVMFFDKDDNNGENWYDCDVGWLLLSFDVVGLF